MQWCIPGDSHGGAGLSLKVVLYFPAMEHGGPAWVLVANPKIAMAAKAAKIIMNFFIFSSPPF